MLRNRALAPARFSSSRPCDRKASFAACSSTCKAPEHRAANMRKSSFPLSDHVHKQLSCFEMCLQSLFHLLADGAPRVFVIGVSWPFSEVS